MTKRNNISRCATENEIKELWDEWLDWYKKKNGHGFSDGDHEGGEVDHEI